MNPRSLVALCACLVVCACVGPPGEAGKPCTVIPNDDGTATVTCPDGTKTVLRGGKNGTDGVDGSSGRDGMNGVSCSLSTTDAGAKRITCSDGTSVTISDGRPGIDANALVDFSTLTDAEKAVLDMKVVVGGITDAARPVVSFSVVDGKGRGVRNIAPSLFSGIALLQVVRGTLSDAGVGLGNDTWVSHITNCATCTASTETGSATTVVDNGDGTYRYTFLKNVKEPTPYDGGVAVAGVAFDSNAVHRFGMRLVAPGNPFRPVDAVYDYLPATGADTTGQTDKVSTAACLECHMQWRANALNAGGLPAFHNGQRYEAQYCVVCHNDQRKYRGSLITGNPVLSEPAIDGLGNLTPTGGQTRVAVLRGEALIHMPVFIHKIHMGRQLTLKGPYAALGAELNSIGLPQSPANCTKCHKGAAQADNWKTKPSRRACGGCHDEIDFVTGDGHLAGPALNDDTCVLCHSASYIAVKHVPLEPIDPNNSYLVPGGSSNTNASWLGNPLNPPAGAKVLSYQLPPNAVSVVDAGGGNLFAQTRFKLLSGDAGVVFNVSDGTNELIDGFTGSPSVTCAFAMPQDGLDRPADFNASVSGYLKALWRGTATGAGAGTLTGPDSAGFYTATLTGVALRPGASLLTCGIGYSYSLASTQPLTQTDLGGKFAYDAGSRVGGLSIPPLNVWQTAVGYAGRRGATSSASLAGQIVSTAKCNNCHNQLGVGPSFHAGQRNDAPTCAFCHTQNRTSSGWSAGSASFVHAIHGAGKRTVPFNWHATSEEEGFFEVAFPGRPQLCEGCHNPGGYDFSGAWYTEANVATRLMQTVATGTFNSSPTLADGGVNTQAWAVSPYVVGDGGTSYGTGYAYNAGTGVVTEASPLTLANSPISNACFGCHDSKVAVAHMEGNGGRIYKPRPQVLATVEQCLLCHGPGKVAAIKDVHYK